MRYSDGVVTVRQSKTLRVWAPDHGSCLRVELTNTGTQVFWHAGKDAGVLVWQHDVDLTNVETAVVLAFLDAAGLRSPARRANTNDDALDLALVQDELAMSEIAVQQLREAGTDEDHAIADSIEANLPSMRAVLFTDLGRAILAHSTPLMKT
jgi:hypothetical protein